jgi:hypothetical protein
MWIPSKSAFRAGIVGDEWDDANIGLYSIAFGNGTTASGYISTAMGYHTKATNDFSFASGIETIASGPYSTAMGNLTTASGSYSLSMGKNTSASGDNSTAMGDQSTASGYKSTAMGFLTTASGAYSTAMGSKTTASGVNSIALGNEIIASNQGSIAIGGSYTTSSGIGSIAMGSSTNASGMESTAMGAGTFATGFISTAMGNATTASGNFSTATGYGTLSKSLADFVTGSYNDGNNTSDPYFFNSQNRIFEIGNGTGNNSRSNAMTVLQNGNVGIGTVSPIAPLNFASSLGDKIIMWTNGTTHYGMGIQPSLLQIYSESPGTDIAFGTGSSSSFNETLRIKGIGDGSLKGNFTVQNGKGIIRSTDGTQKKELSTNVLVNVSLAAGASTSINFTFPESFSASPDVYVGNVVSGAGGWAEVILMVANVSTTGGTLYVHNTTNGIWTPNFTVKVIAIGPQ